jgi:adenosylcobinamide kinase/adenosylcobinamide-phosphate guanylyltransferase
MTTFSKRAKLGHVLVLGGARSGKSAFAEALAAKADSIEYVATAPPQPGDAEWEARVEAHRRRRPSQWRTTETLDLAGVFGRAGGPVLVDSITAWLTAVLDDSGAWIEAPGWRGELDEAVETTLRAWKASSRSILAVSDEVGGGLVPTTVSGRLFRDALGLLNQRFAATADTVWLVTAGIPQRIK